MIVGVLGDGQLARMLALAGHPLGLQFIVLSPVPNSCAASVAEQICARFDDEAALRLIAQRADVVTWEFENVPARAVQYLSQHVPVLPPPAALAASQDRLSEKRLFRDLDIPTAAFAPVESLTDLETAAATIGWPAVLKMRMHGYDGKGQATLRRSEDLRPAWAALGGVPAIVEALVPFEREVSVIAVRARNGDMAFYPLVTNTHRDGILRVSISGQNDPLQAQANEYARRLLERLDYVGILALELFAVQGELLANEFAPRVHNSGHWTIEGAETSQFENHLRAILGFPLGSTAAIGHSAMVNLIGDVPDPGQMLSVPGVHLHLYGKERRPGRKLGHVTLREMGQPGLHASLQRLLALLPSAEAT